MKMDYLDKLIGKYENLQIDLQVALNTPYNQLVQASMAAKLRTIDTIIAELKELRIKLCK